VNGAFEGDMVRPLGLVTLNFGYAEYELDSFIERLSSVGLAPVSWSQRPIGQKLLVLTEAIRTLDESAHPQLDTLLDEARQLLDRRNVLIHGCLLAGGRIASGRTGVKERFTSVEDLNSLAEAIFNWKERLWSYRCRHVEPLLEARLLVASPNTSLEHMRGE
jgi:hypothetical protein